MPLLGLRWAYVGPTSIAFDKAEIGRKIGLKTQVESL